MIMTYPRIFIIGLCCSLYKALFMHQIKQTVIQAWNLDSGNKLTVLPIIHPAHLGQASLLIMTPKF